MTPQFKYKLKRLVLWPLDLSIYLLTEWYSYYYWQRAEGEPAGTVKVLGAFINSNTSILRYLRNGRLNYIPKQVKNSIKLFKLLIFKGNVKVVERYDNINSQLKYDSL